MNEILEIEYKILLNKEIYNKIKEDYKNYLVDDYLQINYYFTNELMQKKGYMLRIREKKDNYELTLKRPVEGARIETNILIDSNTKDKIFNKKLVNNEIYEILENEGIHYLDLNNEYSLSTYRYDYKLDYGILSLDYNEYLDTKDYELEYEVNNKDLGYQQFISIINKYNLEYKNNCTSKVARTMNRYKEIKEHR